MFKPKFTLLAVIAFPALGLLMGCPPAPAPGGALGSGVDENADPGQVGQAIIDEIDSMVPADSAKIVGALRGQTGPVGSVVGLALDDGTRLYLLGDTGADGTVLPTGAVLEDDAGNLIMMQESREQGSTITYATGDSVDVDASGAGLRLTYTLNASVPPSTLVINIDENGVATLDEAASIINRFEHTPYNVDRIRLGRQVTTLKARPAFQSNLSEDCPYIDTITATIDRFCALWGFLTAEAPLEAINVACTTNQAALDGLRGSDPFSGLVAPVQGPELAPRLIAGLKTGTEVLCRGIDAGWDVAKLIKSANFVDLSCLAYSLADDGTRLLSTGARNLPQVLCDALTFPDIGVGCSNTCVAANNGRCEDGGPLSVAAICLRATDCYDCGKRDVPGCSDTCETARNNICEEGITCELGTDCYDCGGATPVPGCSDRCDSAQDGVCDDGSAGSDNGTCAFGTDCTDCGPRDPEDEPDVPAEDCSDDGICNLSCPDFEPDPNCSNAELCARKGLCCIGDSTCDIQSCNEEDPDCTNADLCSRSGICCDDDNICQGATLELECPTPDLDCVFCGVFDLQCIQGCDPPDPDCPPEGFGTVTGNVLNATTGAPLAGATVVVLTTALSTTTDASGGFTIGNVPAGVQTLVGTLENFADGSFEVVVSANGSVFQTILLVEIGGGDPTGGSFGDFFYQNASGATGTDPALADISVSGSASTPTFNWTLSNVVSITVAEVAGSGLYGVVAQQDPNDPDGPPPVLHPPVTYGDFGIPNTIAFPGFTSATPLSSGRQFVTTVITGDGTTASLVFGVN